MERLRCADVDLVDQVVAVELLGGYPVQVVRDWQVLWDGKVELAGKPVLVVELLLPRTTAACR